MTKHELSQIVAARSGVTIPEAVRVIESIMNVIKSNVAKGESVYLRGFGTFTQKHRAKKKARNISKGTSVIVPAHDIPYFRPSDKFKIK